MQSGYGRVSGIPAFISDTCGADVPSVFTVSSSSSGPQTPTDIAASHELKYHPLPNYQTVHHPHQPFMHQLSQFQAVAASGPHHIHQFQLFHHHSPTSEGRRGLMLPHQLGIDQHDSGPENSFVSFKLGVSGSGRGGRDLNEEDGSEDSRFHQWHREDEHAATIKEPSWRPLDIDYITRNNKRCKEMELDTSTSNYSNQTKSPTDDRSRAAAANRPADAADNYKVFSELEAIYKPGSGPNQTGSGSVLTGDDTPIINSNTPAAGPHANDPNAGGSTETSAGDDDEAPVKKPSKATNSRKRKRSSRRQNPPIAAFFESLLKQLIDHQEMLHNKFLEAMERRDEERSKIEALWRNQESAKWEREAAVRAHQRSLAASREDAIVAFLERLTGERIELPPRPQFCELENRAGDKTAQMIPQFMKNKSVIALNTSRWPKAEVQALIQVRSGLESRFQEPGLKGPLWDEVSSIMGSMGYQRSAKRCKEKWENINKYFRKTKESGKKRQETSKTCPYFQHLDQLYSSSVARNCKSLNSPSSRDAETCAQKQNSELLDAILGSEGEGRGVGDRENEEDEIGGRGECGRNEEQEEEQEDDDKDDLNESALFFQRLQS